MLRTDDANKLKHKHIAVNGAKLHNLKDISVQIPHNKLTVITGVSGSGKSTLAFDTIYAEGQRRFVESLSSYARQFLERMNKPDVESITGLPPAIAIEQRPFAKNPRSTVGTSTEIYDYIRLLYGRIGITKCKSCGEVVQKDTPETVVEEILQWGIDDKLLILFPLNLEEKNIKEEMTRLKELGFFRFVVGDADDIFNIDIDPIPEAIEKQKIYILVDRLVLRTEKEDITRLTDSIESAFKIGSGRIVIRNLTKQLKNIYSNLYECAKCEIVYEEPDPKIFSFNNPRGACPTCQGFGRTVGIDEDLVIPNKARSIRRGAIEPFKTPKFSIYQRQLLKIADKYKLPLDEPYESLTKEQNNIVWNGKGEYIGINGFFAMLEENAYKMHYRILMSRYRGYAKCKACDGSRLRTSARQVFVYGKSIPDIILMPLDKLLSFFTSLTLTEYHEQIAGQVVKEIKWRLQLLVDIGLGYLTLDRLSHTLSGGEAQRINLSTALGSSLVGTLYVMDEPSIGMHPVDTERLLKILFKLRSLGNTIIVVEHDLDIIRNADYLIDIGPKAGSAGGEVVYEGKYENLNVQENSLTSQYIKGIKKIPINTARNPGNSLMIQLIEPKKHNLRIDKLNIPLGCIVAVTGVSGSGKSTLIYEILFKGLKKYDKGYSGETDSYNIIYGGEQIDFIELVDQTPIGKSSRSTPITYTKAFDAIRELFANTQAAKQLGWRPGHFSFNVPGGRCDVCEGEGSVTVDMQFLPDVHLECEACKGTRFKKEARNILFKNKSIVDVLNMTVDEAIEFFKESNKIVKKLKILQDVGLGYLLLGQPSSMLSGGEAQRIKLASHLDIDSNNNGLFLFDEPTTGLHIDDISKLIDCFRRLIEAGHSIIIIEHNLHVIASADWIIDLGPEAGQNGGRVVAIGTPETVMKSDFSHTGKVLKEFFENY